ncbi:hypothetical protein LJR118_000611 [Acidovorax sp. LjRoot118]|uniref:hypothetical protein n=1 Tax=Acidovorax sp. LjRoot118 TaxID=3342256 RepID=UPI003ED0860D
MAKQTTADKAEAGAAAPASTTPTPVHTYAQKPAKPAHHLPTPPRPRDQFTGKGGTYTRDPATGERTPVKPEADQAPGEDSTAAA